MKKTTCMFMVLCCFAGGALATPNWSKLRVDAEPGVGVAGLKLNEALPKEWPSELGTPDLSYRYHDTGEGFRHFLWGQTEGGQLSKGIEVRTVGKTPDTSTVVDILVRGIRATVSEEKLFIGLPVERLGKRSKSIQRDGTTTYLLPGLVLEAQDGKLSGLRISSPLETRWRFAKWTVRPGLEVGPIKLNKPLDETLFADIGEPHKKTGTDVTWTSPEGAQRLEIELDGRSSLIQRVRGIGLPWRTEAGVTLGDSPGTYQAKHPEAKTDMGRNYQDTVVKLPGLRANFVNGRLRSFDLYPINQPGI